MREKNKNEELLNKKNIFIFNYLVKLNWEKRGTRTSATGIRQ